MADRGGESVRRIQLWQHGFLGDVEHPFIVFLRNLQSLRSYMLHRNSKKLDKDKKRAFEYFGLNEDKSNSQSVSNNVLSLGATAISNMIKQL